MAPIVSNTVFTCDGGATKWKFIYPILEDEELEVVEVMATVDDETPSHLQFKDIACSFLHRIVARATLLPYTNMIRWVLDKSMIIDRQLRTYKDEILGYFRPEYLKIMYKLLDPQDTYNSQFVAKFAKKNQDPFKEIQGWRKLEKNFKYEKTGMYSITSLANHYIFAVAMLCILYGLSNNTKSSINWLPLIESSVNSLIINWVTILSKNLVKEINEYRQTRTSSSKCVPLFFMSAYIFYAICFSTNF